MVVNQQGVALGRVRKKDLEERRDAVIEDVMEEGPTAIRPGEELAEVTSRMQQRGVDSVLVGTLYRKDVEEAIHAAHAGARG